MRCAVALPARSTEPPRPAGDASRGRLKIFFGASSGVGKTYSMLAAARAAHAGGNNLVIGHVETHGRIDIQRLMRGLELLPALEVNHRGLHCSEFDLDAALIRRPAILVVDELAHANPAGGRPRQRHERRWQDVEELLAAGITVWTTVSVQHLEGLHDVVADITGLPQQDTIPDRLFDQADDVELIDLPLYDLLARYPGGTIDGIGITARARDHAARDSMLLALRELALRRTADRISAESRTSGCRDSSPRNGLRMRAGGGFDVTAIECQPAPAAEPAHKEFPSRQRQPWSHYWAALGISLACTALAAVMYPYFAPTNLIMVYLLGATVAALKIGRGPASAAAVANVLAFDFFFVPPRYSFAVADLQYVVTFGVMLTVALIIATLVASVRAQTQVAVTRERRTALLYAMSQELVSNLSLDELAEVAVRHLAETFGTRNVVLFPDDSGHMRHPAAAPRSDSLRGADLAVAQWVYDHCEAAGPGTDTLQAADAQYLPLKGSQRVLGVLAVHAAQRRRLLLPEQRQLMETFAAQIALALERARLQQEAQQSRIAAETEGIRNTLLASISHDLRTPLAVIEGASSALCDPAMHFDAAARRSLLAKITSKSSEMAAIISNVLDLMRLQSGQFTLRLDWVVMNDLVNSALRRQATQLLGHRVEVCVPTDLPAMRVDGPLLLQVFINLLDNIARHTPAGTQVTVSGNVEESRLRIVIDDTGPGLPPGDPERLFAKFHRGSEESSKGGAGLGLSICRAIVSTHGGQIEAAQRPGGGARFSLSLPLTQTREQ